MTDKRLVVKVDSTLKNRRAAYACYIKPYFSGVRGKSFPGAYYSSMIPTTDSIHAEMMGIILAIENATTFANITKIDKSSTILQVRNDCMIAIESLDLILDGKNSGGAIGKQFMAAVSKWKQVELAKVPRSDLKTVHLLSRRTNKQITDIEKEWNANDG